MSTRISDEQIIEAIMACDDEDPTKEGWIRRTRIKWARAVLALATHEPTQATGGEVDLANIESQFNACMHQEHCKKWKSLATNAAPAEARKPLTAEQRDALSGRLPWIPRSDLESAIDAIEAAHGITAEGRNHG